MAINFKKIWTGLTVVPKTATSADSKGELEVIDGSGKLQYHNGTSVSPVLTEAHSATITNKVIDADDNTISDLEVDNLKAGVLDIDLEDGPSTDSQLPSALAVQTLVANAAGDVQADVDDLITLTGVPANSTDLGTFTGAIIPDASDIKEALQALETFAETDASNLAAHIADASDAHDASAISNVPAGTIAATDVQAAINELDGDVQTVQSNLTAHINDASDAHDASAISNVPSGNLAATDVQGALNELQTDIDTRATSAALSAHIADTSTHGTTGDIVGTTDTQTLTNKTITGASIQTPTRLDVKQDTKANLETYALTATNGQLVFATDTKEMFQVVDNALVPVGAAGGDSDVDALIIQTFETAALTDFTQTGLVLDETDPLHGAVSAKLVHQNAINQSFKQVIAVDEKFRGAAMTFSVTAKSSASSGNVTVLFYDETNTEALQATQQINAGATPQTFQYGVTIPSDCLSFSYTITALPEAGSPETFIDDITIKNYWQGTALEGQTEYTFEVPAITEWASYTPTFTGFGTATNIEFEWRQVGQNVEIRGKFTTGTTTATEARISLPNSYVSGSTSLIPSIKSSGFFFNGESTTNSHGGIILMEPSVSYVTFGTSQAFGSAAINPVTKVNGNTFNTGTTLYLDYKVPINGLSATESKTVILTDLVPARSMPANASIEVPTITEWESYTPVFTGLGTVTNNSARWRQVGDTVQIEGTVNPGTSTAVPASITLPNSYTLNTTKISLSNSTANPGVDVGEYSIDGTSSGVGNIVTATATSASVVYFARFHSSAGLSLDVANGSTIITATDLVSYHFTVPVNELSATETHTWTATQAVVTESSDSMIKLNTSNGYGSTNTFIRRFSNIEQSLGSDIVYADSATLGGSFTVQTSGVYSISYTDDVTFTTTDAGTGLSVNASGAQLTSSIVDIAAVNKLSVQRERGTAGQGTTLNVNWVGYLNAGDIVRAHTTDPLSGTASRVSFTMSKQGSLDLVQTVADQKIEIPTSELRFEGCSALGGTNTGIAKFDTIAKLRGDAFTITNTSANGTEITMTKAGKLSVSAQLTRSSATLYLWITKNQATLTSGPVVLASESMATSGSSAASTHTESVSWTGKVQVGDVIRIAASATPTADGSSNLNLYFQEEEVAVAVTNVLPQFSDSDSEIRVDTGNGFGSPGQYSRRFSNVRTNFGGDISYADSSTAGSSFTILTDGLYDITYSDCFNATTTIGISKNTDPSIALGSIDAANLLAVATTAAAGTIGLVSVRVNLNAGDVIRPTTAGNTTHANASFARFTISKAGKPNVTGVDVTPFVETDLLVSQSSLMNSSATFGNATITGALTSSNGNGIYSYSASTGIYTMLKDADVTISATHGAAGAATVVPAIYINGVLTQYAYSVQSTNFRATTSHSQKLVAGSTFHIRNETANSTNSQTISVLAQALSESIVTPPETFSTDTASLTYAGSATYTLSTLANAPVGTFITFTYAGGTNTATQTTTAPTQTVSDMNTNGIRIFTRVTSATSTAASPAMVAIQIGKGMKGVSLALYKSTGKVNTGSIDTVQTSSTSRDGLQFKEYNENTGILLLDAGYNGISGTTSATFRFADTTSGTDGYITINASKNPALTGFNTNKVYLNAEGNAGQVITNSVTDIPFITVEDTHGAWDGDQYTVPESGMYTISTSCAFTVSAARAFNIYINGSNYRRFNFVNASQGNHQGSYTGWFNKGQVLSIRETNSGGTLNNSASIHYLTISKV